MTLAVAAGCFLIVPLHFGRRIQQALDAAPGPVSTRLPPGLVESAAFLRTRAAASDVVRGVSKADVPFLGSLAERRTYLGRDPSFWQSYYPGSPDQAVAQNHQATLRRLLAVDRADAVRSLLDQTGIDWFVFGPGKVPAWPPEVLGRPAFESHG